MENKKWITIKVKAKTWWKIKALKNKDGRNLNYYVEQALEEYLAKWEK